MISLDTLPCPLALLVGGDGCERVAIDHISRCLLDTERDTDISRMKQVLSTIIRLWCVVAEEFSKGTST